jgi:hypothetical protein
MLKRLLGGTVASAALLFSLAARAESPPVGVYGCYDAMINYKGQLTITPMPFVMFGLVDAATYADWDGHHGHYTYDPAAGMLTMTDGSRQGWRYHKAGDWSFRLIDNAKGTEIYTCPFDAGKNPAKGPW